MFWSSNTLFRVVVGLANSNSIDTHKTQILLFIELPPAIW